MSADRRADLSQAKENQSKITAVTKGYSWKRLVPGPTKVTGSYVEKDDKTGEETKVKERSHVVIDRGKMGKRKFKKDSKST